MNRLSAFLTFQTLVSLHPPHYTCFVWVCVCVRKRQREVIYCRLVPVTMDFVRLYIFSHLTLISCQQVVHSRICFRPIICVFGSLPFYKFNIWKRLFFAELHSCLSWSLWGINILLQSCVDPRTLGLMNVAKGCVWGQVIPVLSFPNDKSPETGSGRGR